MKKARKFHCQTCGTPCEIYKKGKKHRVLICPNCGVLATNPIPLLPLAVKAGAGILGGFAGKKIADKIGLGKKDKEELTTGKTIIDYKDIPNDYVKISQALR